MFDAGFYLSVIIKNRLKQIGKIFQKLFQIFDHCEMLYAQ